VELLIVALAGVVVGAFLGAAYGSSRAFSLMRRARTLRSVNANVRRFMPDVAPTRSTADILAGRIRITIGRNEHVLPVLTRAAESRWLASLDASFNAYAAALDSAPDSGVALGLLAAHPDELYEMLLAYDETHVLPSHAEWIETGTSAEVVYAILEVWRAANPLLDYAVAATTGKWTSGTPPEQSSSSQPSTDGSLPTSNGSPQNSSEPTSTPPASDETLTPIDDGSKQSSPPASDTSSPETPRPIASGAAASSDARPRWAQD